MTVAERSNRSGAQELGSRLAQRFPVLVDAYRVVRYPTRESQMWRDYVESRRETSFIRHLPPGDRTRRVLVALYREDVFETKIGMVLATALRLRGLAPTVLLPSRRASRSARLARCAGPVDLITWASIEATDDQQAEIDGALEWYRQTKPGFDVLRTWTFHGHQAGSHVLSSVIRLTFEADPDLGDPAIRALTEKVLRDVLIAYVRAEDVLDRVDPAVVLVEEANYSLQGPLVDVAVARGIDVIQTVSIWRDDALWSKRITADTRRTDPKSVDPATLSELEREAWTSEKDAELDREMALRYGSTWVLSGQFQADTRAFDGADIQAMLDIDPQKPTAVIFSHVLWDASLFFGEDLFSNYGDWLAQTIRAAASNPNVNWLIKAHPANVFRQRHGDVRGLSREVALAREVLPDLPGHVRLLLPDTPISTLSLFEYADYGLTVRGTPGLEMASFGKVVLTAGTGHYSGLGFTRDSATRDEYLDRVANIDELGAPSSDETLRARRYLHALLCNRPWPLRSVALRFEFRDRGWHPLDRNVRWNVSSLEALRANGDLDDWASWVLDSTTVDYLRTPPATADAAAGRPPSVL
jgi:hypothetical protein